MSIDLESHVRTDETVLWRETPMPIYRRIVLYVILVLWVAATMNPIFIHGDENFRLAAYGAGVMFIGFGIVAGIILALGNRSGWESGKTILTDRRVLHWDLRTRTRDENRLVTIPLADVTGVGLSDSVETMTVRVDRPSPNPPRELASPRPQALAVALADAAGLRRPSLVGRLEHLPIVCLLLGGGPLGIALGLWTPISFFNDPSDVSATVQILNGFGSAAFAIFIGIPLGIHLVAILAFMLMPRYAGAEEAGNWLGLRPRQMVFRRLGWKSRPYIWLAQRVYGGDLMTSTES